MYKLNKVNINKNGSDIWNLQIFSCDLQVKKWCCHFVRLFVHHLILFFSKMNLWSFKIDNCSTAIIFAISYLHRSFPILTKSLFFVFNSIQKVQYKLQHLTSSVYIWICALCKAAMYSMIFIISDLLSPVNTYTRGNFILRKGAKLQEMGPSVGP